MPNPLYKALAGLQIHEALVGCGIITQSEFSSLLDGAGFANVRVAPQPMANRLMMLAGKPEPA